MVDWKKKASHEFWQSRASTTPVSRTWLSDEDAQSHHRENTLTRSQKKSICLHRHTSWLPAAQTAQAWRINNASTEQSTMAQRPTTYLRTYSGREGGASRGRTNDWKNANKTAAYELRREILGPSWGCARMGKNVPKHENWYLLLLLIFYFESLIKRAFPPQWIWWRFG